MTKEEKARDIIGCSRDCRECGGVLAAVTGCTHFKELMAMANWKDEQVRCILWSHWERLKNECRKDAAIAVSDIIYELFCDDSKL